MLVIRHTNVCVVATCRKTDPCECATGVNHFCFKCSLTRHLVRLKDDERNPQEGFDD
jgi:hypothetical protein